MKIKPTPSPLRGLLSKEMDKRREKPGAYQSELSKLRGKNPVVESKRLEKASKKEITRHPFKKKDPLK